MLRTLERTSLIPPVEERLAHGAFPNTALGRTLRRQRLRGGFPAGILDRSSGLMRGTASCRRAMVASILPSAYVATESIGDRAYSVRFSAGGLLAAASQSGSIRILDVATSGALKPRARIDPRGVQWAITHVDWLGENKLLYSSMHNVIHIATLPNSDGKIPPQQALSLHSQVGVYAFAVAPGGVELTAATSDGQIVIFDIDAGRVSETFVAHRDDINAVCYAASGGAGADIIVTGSDDGLLKVFDRRAARGRAFGPSV